MLTSTAPPISLDPPGGVYWSVSSEPTATAAAVLRIANIGLPGPQLVLLFDPYPPPAAKLLHPSLGAADWLGLTQLTTIQSPAYAGAAPISSMAAATAAPSSVQAGVSALRRARVSTGLGAALALSRLNIQARPEHIGPEGSTVCSRLAPAHPEP